MKLSENEIAEALTQLDGWTLSGNSIVKVFATGGFPQTLGLVVSIGALCQQHDHHPDYLTLKYSSVEVSFSTHSAGGITNKDIEIARDINSL